MKEEFDKLIYDFLSGSIAKEDLHKLNEWIYSDPENQKYFEQQKRIWLLSAEYKNVSVHEEQAYNRFAKRIRKHKIAGTRKVRKNLFVRYAGYAAAIIILLFTTPLIINNFTTPDDSLISEVYAPRKSKLKMKLPDGSTVWLNADSRLSYSESFSRKNRNVRLEGEGYFEVEHGEHPFVIQTDSAQIKVLGTKFNVKNYGDENYIKVSLLEGSIVLLCINQEFIMKPNQTMTVNKLDQTYKLTESADYAEQWINCKVFWDEVPMSIISKELERQFDVTFAFESEQLKNLIFHGSFIIETNNLEKILDIMSETNKFSYSIEKDKVYIHSLKK